MQSNFGHARELLEQAWLQLSGDDKTSQKSRLAIDILVEAVATADNWSHIGRQKSSISSGRPNQSEQ